MGKSTLFNLLTGLNQHVGNWPGKTVEMREGFFTYNEQSYRIVDLPGTYSLTANSPEEVITREFILRENPCAVIALVSAAQLERSLYLVSELVGLPIPLLVVLNMLDVAEQEGIQVEPKVLEAALGVPVIPMTATRALGVDRLLEEIENVKNQPHSVAVRLPQLDPVHHQVVKDLLALIADKVPQPYPPLWAAVKLLEGDLEIVRTMRAVLPPQTWDKVHQILKQHEDALLAIASARYEWIGRLVRAAVIRPKAGQISITNRLDRWVSHPFWGIIILAFMLGAVFWLTFTIGTPLQEWLDTNVISFLSDTADQALASAPFWLRGLILDGIIGGVGSVLTFLPILIIFFATFGLLEDVGYMARAAYVMDNFMHMMGLHGKSFLPLFLGFGCNVPAVLGTRVIDTWSARLLTILIAPFVPCTARMAVVAFLAPAFFGQNAPIISWGLIILALSMLMLSGVILNAVLFHGERSAFVMEMPLYHLPNWRTIGLLVWQRSISFVRKAGTIILGFSVLVWLLSVMPYGELHSSFLAQLGMLIEPFGKWIGLDWRLSVALLTSFVAKENSIATLGIIFGTGENVGLAQILVQNYSLASALSFLVISTLFIPCIATVAVIRQETNSWKWTFLSMGLLLATSIAAGGVVYWLATLIGL